MAKLKLIEYKLYFRVVGSNQWWEWFEAPCLPGSVLFFPSPSPKPVVLCKELFTSSLTVLLLGALFHVWWSSADGQPDTDCSGEVGSVRHIGTCAVGRLLKEAKTHSPGTVLVVSLSCWAQQVVRDPEWEGVVDGEICGLGPLADSVRTFLHWVPIKLDSREALRLSASCGDALAREVTCDAMPFTQRPSQ